MHTQRAHSISPSFIAALLLFVLLTLLSLPTVHAQKTSIPADCKSISEDRESEKLCRNYHQVGSCTECTTAPFIDWCNALPRKVPAELKTLSSQLCSGLTKEIISRWELSPKITKKNKGDKCLSARVAEFIAQYVLFRAQQSSLSDKIDFSALPPCSSLPKNSKEFKNCLALEKKAQAALTQLARWGKIPFSELQDTIREEETALRLTLVEPSDFISIAPTVQFLYCLPPLGSPSFDDAPEEDQATILVDKKKQKRQKK